MRHALTPLILLLAVLPLVSSGCYIRVGLDPSNDDDDSSPSDDDDTTEADDDDVTDPPDDDDATDPPDDDDATGTPFSIDEIDPNDGSTDGGYTAEIFYEGDLGGAEEDEIEVYFGTTLTEVLAVTDTKLLVTVPPGCVPGEIDVKVELPDGQDDDVEFEFEPAGAGLDGAVFGVYHVEVPAYGVGSGSVEFGFFEPTDSVPLAHLPPLGTCSYNVVPPDSDRSYYPVGASLNATAGTSIIATLSSDDTYTAVDLPVSSVPHSASYSIYGAVDPQGCSLPLETVVSAPPGITVASPNITSTEVADCWYMDGGYGVIEWGGPFDSGDFVFAQIVNDADPAGAPSVTCHGQDNGLILLDEADMIGLAPGLHQLILTRYRVTTTPHPRDGSTMYGVFADTRSGYIFVMLTPGECGF